MFTYLLVQPWQQSAATVATFIAAGVNQTKILRSEPPQEY